MAIQKLDIIEYKLNEFDADRADGALCVISVPGKENSDMTNADDAFVGSGIVAIRDGAGRFTCRVDGIEYKFDKDGNPYNPAAKGLKLYLADTYKEALEIGSVAGSVDKKTATRSADGSVTVSVEGTTSVAIENLNARDQFALQVLHGLLEKSEKNPETFSKNEISHYCDAAYEWASYLMTTAANVRATTQNGSQGSTDTKTRSVDADDLTETSDILLNNLIASLEKPYEKEGTGESITYSERVSIPKLMTFLNNYVKDGETTVGLKDLIDAVDKIAEGSSSEVTIQSLPDVNIGNAGLGRDEEHPIYISGGGGGFPSRQVLAAAFAADAIHDFLTFNTDGAVGYSTKEETKKAILGYLNSYANIDALATAVYNSVKSTIDSRIKAWLEAAKDAEGRSLTVNTPT